MRSIVIFCLSFAVAVTAMADRRPPILDCTGPTGASAATVVDAQKAWSKHLGEASHERSFPLDKSGKLMIEMVLLPPGKYFRGEGDAAVVVTLTQPLWVGKYEVTQQQYESLVGRNPSHFRRAGQNAAGVPVECVSHIDARRYCEIASGVTNAEFRLLTEAEWEYACRAGTRTKYCHGDAVDKLGEFAQFAGNNRKSTAKVGSKAPNAFGLCDMFGNVWEWCADYWSPAYDMRTTIDPIGPDSGRACVTRGGSWATMPDNLRSAYRTLDAETYAGSHLGFRIARLPDAQPLPEPPPILDCTGPEGADAQAVLASQKAWARHFGFSSHQRSFPVDNGGKVWVEMILLPPGKYCQGNEKQPTIVQIKEPLWVGKYEVTQRQYEAVMGNNPSHFQKDGPDATQHPVEKVSHLDVRKFCEAASANSGSEFRLLREMEWEYAYRAGTRTRYYTGDSHDKIFDISQCSENNGVSTARCGSKAPNAFGLYDMGGNVAEWCGEPGWILELPKDPQGLDTSVLRANRGNAWDSQCRSCNATGRSLNTETYAGSQIGFRLARQVLVRRAARAEPKVRMLDTHVHFFDPNRPTAPPRSNDGKPVPKPILPPDLKDLSQPHGVLGCLIVEASSILEDNQWWLDLAAKDAFIVGVIGRLDPTSDDFEKNLRRFAANPLFRGIRVYNDEVKIGLKGNLVERLKLLVELNLTLDVLGGPDTPADVALLAEQLPKLRIVINHAANLRIDGKDPPGKWRDGMAAAAKHPNVFCKVSALVEQTGHKQAPRDVQYYRPVIDTLWELFGEDRLLFGSNWPVSNGGAPYETVVGIVQDYYTAKGDRAAAKFFLGNSQTAYGLKARQP